MRIITLAVIAMFILSCDSGPKCGSCDGISKKTKQAIFDNLNSRYTGFEIVEIRKDSANVYTAITQIQELNSKIAINNSRIAVIFAKASGDLTLTEYTEAKAFYDTIQSDLNKFTGLKSKPDACYYVKFLVYKNEAKVPTEEYFYINLDKAIVLRRPVNNEEFINELNFKKTINNSLEYYMEFAELDRKFAASK